MAHPSRRLVRLANRPCRCGAMMAGYNVPPVVEGAMLVAVHLCPSCDQQRPNQ